MMLVPDNFYRASTQRAVGSGIILVCFFIISILVTTLPKGRDDTLMEDVPNTTSGGEQVPENSGDIAWMITATALVLFMTPGLAFFYGGMVQVKNMISTLMYSFVIMGVVGVLWVIIGFSLAFGENALSGLIGNPATHYFYKDVGAQATFVNGIPDTVYATYQATFAMITPAILTGAVVERAHFNAMMLFSAIWHIVVYCPIAHMEWGPGGLILEWGHRDFAGGTVVHMSSGISAFVLARLVGSRKGAKDHEHAPAHVPYVLLGAAMLWFGWNGFNVGSALGANTSAGQALVTTNTCACSCLVAWCLWDYVMGRKVNAVGAACGAVVGLVVITPACGFVTVGAALIMGIVGAMISNTAVHWFKAHSSVDDTLDVFACHGIGGISGMFLTACFASPDVYPNDEGLNGLFYGEGKLFWHTIVVALLVSLFFICGTVVIYHIVNAITPFRVTEEEEAEGLDSSLHGEMVTMNFGAKGEDLDGSATGKAPSLNNGATGKESVV